MIISVSHVVVVRNFTEYGQPDDSMGGSPHRPGVSLHTNATTAIGPWLFDALTVFIGDSPGVVVNQDHSVMQREQRIRVRGAPVECLAGPRDIG